MEWTQYYWRLGCDGWPRHHRSLHRSEKDLQILDAGDVFDGSDVVPGFRLPVRELCER